MCGIFGVLPPFPSQAELQSVTDLLVHRGPDDAGHYTGEGIALAARRLSIIDIQGGHQPLSNEDGSVWIACNGEVVNAPDLRAELQNAGHRFKTLSDTETIVHAYEQWGDDAITRLRGMFAFAVWDVPRRRLLLARDRLGIKPLYYAEAGGRFAFASEIRPILTALPGLSRRLDGAALWRLFELGFIPSPLTAFEGIYKLPAAHTLSIENGRASLEAYWQLVFPPSGRHRRIATADAADQFIAHLREAVSTWRLSDVPVGSLLSGGIDSAALAALLTEVGGEPIHTFTIGFSAASHDEAARARATADAIGSQHHEITFSNADFDDLPRVIRHLEEPQCSATSLPIYRLYRACHASGFKVILTGEGADELLGGYHWFDGDRRARPLLRLPRALRKLIARAPMRATPAARRVLASGVSDPVQRYALWQQVADRAQLSAVLRVPARPAWQSQALSDEHHPFDRFAYLDATTRLIDFINFEVDRMSMSNSVEARPPFLDHRLWEFCATLPPEVKLSALGNKLLLRIGMKDRLPEAVRRRPKLGLATPHAEWWRADRLPAWAEDCLGLSALTETGYFDAREVARLREAHRAHRLDASRALMGVLTTQLWHAQFIQ